MFISKAKVTPKSGSSLPDQAEDMLRVDDSLRENTLKKIVIQHTRESR